jgi:metal-responsive CopG/Arc/MetJ family transcriptional regulator
MKIAVSMPDDLCREASDMAKEAGITRSKLMAKAMQNYILQTRRQTMLERLNAVYGDPGFQDDALPIREAALGHLRELTKDDQW